MGWEWAGAERTTPTKNKAALALNGIVQTTDTIDYSSDPEWE
jgi:hypothetical protein